MDMHAPGNLNISTSPQHGDAALFDAAFEGHVEVLRLLLDSKANVNAANKVRCSSWSQCIRGMRHGAEIQV
jgi:ankyrin repeat protein